jgi:hypothetical protein
VLLIMAESTPTSTPTKTPTEALLDRIEVAVGAIDDRGGRNATLIKEIIQAVNGLRSQLGLLRPH